MRIVVYIGHHKVGSTALQVFLSQNSHRLMGAGILYPAVDMQAFAHLLAKAMGKGDVRAYLPGNVREPHSALAYQMIREASDRPVPPQYKMLPSVWQMLHAIRMQIAELQPHTVILCSEAFSNFGEVDPTLITRLRDAFPQAEFEIYCAFRRPDQYLVAWHGQRLKVAEQLPALREIGYRAYAKTIHFNFRKVIEPWKLAFPESRIILRNYADILDAGGSPEDFMSAVGGEWPEGLLPVGKANRSLPLAGMEIVRRGNLELPKPEAHKFAQFMIHQTGKLVAEKDGNVEMFTPRDRARLLADFHPINVYLATLVGAPSFFPDINEIAEPRPVPELKAVAEYLEQLSPDDMPSAEIGAFVARLQSEFKGGRA